MAATTSVSSDMVGGTQARIRCMYPDKLGKQMKDMFNYTDIKGKSIISNMKSLLNDLSQKWKGTDAVAHLKNLSSIYNAINENIANFQLLIVKFNNEKILELQKYIVSIGESCQKVTSLSTTISKTDISRKGKAGKTYVADNFSVYIDEAKVILEDYKTFINTLENKKNTVIDNLTEGCGRAQFIETYKKLNDNAIIYKNTLTKINNELETVAKNKNILMGKQ